MNIQKPIAIVVAILINIIVLAWFHNWSTMVIASAATSQPTSQVLMLPAITVHPTAEQLREVRRLRATPGHAGAGVVLACLAMPYYSFAEQSPDCTAG